MKLTNCNTQEKVDCGCTPAFSSYVNNSLSVLDVGTLTGGSCTFSAYVIDWYRDGIHSLVSGTVGSAPDVTAFHPFTGAAAIPVEGGTWVPIIRWVVISGVKVYSVPTKCHKWCDDLGGLPPMVLPEITVLSLNCADNNNYYLSYVTTQDYALASRTLRWYLDVDTYYLSIHFYGYTVADKVEVFYKDTDTLLSSWIIGTNLNSNYDTAFPYRRAFSNLKYVVTLPTFTTGDYVRIVITPSVLETNTNTNWNIRINCLGDIDWAAACAELTADHQTMPIATISMIENAASCRWELKGTLNSVFTVAQQNASPLFVYSSANFGNWQNQITTNIRTTGECGTEFTYGKTVNALSNSGGSSVCTTIVDTITMSYSGVTMIYTFSDETTYLGYKADYNARMASVFGTGFVNDDTDINFYRFLRMFWYNYPLGCGDTGTITWMYFHITSPVTFDDVNFVISIEIVKPTNNFPDEGTCDVRKEYFNSRLNDVQNTIDILPSRTGTSKAKAYNNNGFYGMYYSTRILDVTDSYGGYVAEFVRKSIPCVPALSYDSFFAVFSFYFLRGVITDPLDPENNYDAYWGIDPTSHNHAPFTSWVLIKRVVDGIQTYP